MTSTLVFRQLFDHGSSTYTYILGDAVSKEAVVVDPVDTCIERDLKVISELGLDLKYAVNTHVHADHITGSGLIKKKLPSVKSVISVAAKAQADILTNDADKIQFGTFWLECRSTPGHTSGCTSLVLCGAERTPKMVFTGDVLLIRGCGRTDFQDGDSSKLYKSVHEKLFSLPDETIVYPAHDYKGLTSSTIGEEKKFNPRLTKPLSEFIKIMSELNLPKPGKIDVAVPANVKCGIQEAITVFN
uniref:persulfide dioxygenase n=1 Tax=Spongospora subterranea TaxID=70186 RepID=A0A0H5R6D9_9EUKA|eukprot:CRZ09720.1 hypothetical protein [Spongospora subterranea]